MSDAGRWVLAIDLGTGGPKVALVAPSGLVGGWAASSTDLIHTPDGGVEQDPDQWWSAILSAARRARRGLPELRTVDAVAVTSQWMGSVPVDRTGRHISNAITWMDGRGAPHVRRQIGGFPKVPTTPYGAKQLARWIQLTGGAPAVSGKDAFGHLLFLQNERPELHARAHAILEPMDALNARLTGEICASWDTATGTWTTDTRDLTKVDYVPELIELGGLDASKLPPLRPTGTVVGQLQAEAAAQLDLPVGVPVLTAMPDTASAAIGSGAVADGQAHLYLGTSSWISCHTSRKRLDPLHSIASLPSGIPGKYLVSTEQATAGACRTHLVDNILYPDDGLGGPMPDDVDQLLEACLGGTPPGANGVMYTPWLNGERSPVEDARMRAGFHHLGLTSTRSDMVRAVHEGVAHNSRWLNFWVERHLGTKLESLNFIGGGAMSTEWAQIFADVLDRPIRRMSEPRLANCRGVALAAWVSLGELDWDRISDLISVAEVHEPDPSTRSVHDEMHEAFVATYRKTHRIHASMPGPTR